MQARGRLAGRRTATFFTRVPSVAPGPFRAAWVSPTVADHKHRPSPGLASGALRTHCGEPDWRPPAPGGERRRRRPVIPLPPGPFNGDFAI